MRRPVRVRKRTTNPAGKLALGSECALPDRPPISSTSALALEFLRPSAHSPAALGTDPISNCGHVVRADASSCHVDQLHTLLITKPAAVQESVAGIDLCASQKRVGLPCSFRSGPGLR